MVPLRSPGPPDAPGRQQRRPASHHRLTVKILVSVGSFVVTFGLSQLVPESTRTNIIWSTGGSMFVAGIVFVAQYLLDVEKRLDTLRSKLDAHTEQTTTRLDTHARVTERQLTQGFSKIYLATELFGLWEASQLDPEEMRQMTKLVRNSTKIAADAPPLVQEFAQAEVARLADYLKQLGDSSDLTYEGEDRDWLLGLTKVARESIRATSLSTVDAGGRSFVDGGLWRSDLGERYLSVQRQAIKRGVKIQRVFIVDRQGFAIEDLHKVVEQHVRIGVEVRTLDATAPGVHPRLRDFILFDGVLSYQSTVASPMSNVNPIIVNTSLVTQPERVDERRREFDDLWSADNINVVTVGPGGRLILTPLDDNA